MATPIKSKFGSYKHEFKTARTPRQKQRHDEFVRTKDDFRPKDKSGYMIFEGFDMSEAEIQSYRQQQDQFEAERIATLERFQKADLYAEEYGIYREPAYIRTTASGGNRVFDEIERKRQATQALVKHRSVLKEMNLQRVAGTTKEVAETRKKTEAARLAQSERVRLEMEHEERLARLAEEDWQSRRIAFTPKPRKQPSYQTVVFNAPRRKRPEELLSPEDVEMYDILNELQRQ